VNAEAKRPSLNRRTHLPDRSLDGPGRKAIGQFVNVLRRCGYNPAEIIEAVASASRGQIAVAPRMPRTDAPEFRDAPHIMTVWHTDPSYVDSRGRPLPLITRGPAPSFESLVRRVSRTRRVQDMLQYLVRAGAVKKVGGRYVARMRWVSLRGMQRETSARNLRGLRGMLSNYEHNLLPRDQVESWFEYTAENDHFPQSQEGALADFYLRDCMASLRRVDAFMLRCEQGRKPGEPTMHVGFGMYRYHDEDPAHADIAGPPRNTRRARSVRRAIRSSKWRVP
jgi:hypothetical protein